MPDVPGILSNGISVLLRAAIGVSERLMCANGVCDGNHRNRLVLSFPRTCMYRCGPGNRTKARTEPAPSELLKATGMQPITSRAEPVTSDISLCWGGDKSVGDLWRYYLAGILSCVFAHGYFYACHPFPLTKHLEHRGLCFAPKSLTSDHFG